jgi:DUF971 family protein
MSEFELNPQSLEPEHIAIAKSKGVTIDWRDGHRSEYELKYLRENCPCASCTGAHGGPSLKDRAATADPFQMYKPAAKISAVEPVGNYAIRLVWNDGHSTGIYTYEHLRLICPCVECRKFSQAGR